MNTFALRLAAAAIPYIARLTCAALADVRYHARRVLRLRTKRVRGAVVRAFAIAATQKWF